MLSYALHQQDVLASEGPKASTVVEVEELDGLLSPIEQRTEFLAEDVTHQQAHANSPSPPVGHLRKWTSTPDPPESLEVDRPGSPRISDLLLAPGEEPWSTADGGRLFGLRSGPMRLPFFQDGTMRPPFAVSSHQHGRRRSTDDKGAHPSDFSVPRTTPNRPNSTFWGSVPLLTPPEEKESYLTRSYIPEPATSFSPHVRVAADWPRSYPSSAFSSGPENDSQPLSGSSNTSTQSNRSIHISLPVQDPLDQGQDQTGPETWLGRAITRTVSTIGGVAGASDYAQMVAQILPVRAVRPATTAKPVFELVLEAIQRRVGNPHFSINITHAVPHMIAMDDVPTSPPATPQFFHGGSDYFDLQTVFSLAGVVPLYHVSRSHTAAPQARAITPIIARRSVDVCVLERYIPPISTTEIHDFFRNSGKSYLVDRLAELKLNGGTLLLIYPTRTGAQTFVSQYLNPVLEPLVRRFIFFHSLFPYLGETLSRMEAVDSVPEFPQLSDRIHQLCATLSAAPLERNGPPSTFDVVYHDVGEVRLQRSDWIEYWIHQEQPRLRDDLVRYQREGGRMPAPVGLHEATPASLARELVDGLSKSRDACGGVGIEVGVFIIQRSS